MRLHRLELTALGPFPGTQCVDLDGLGADGLFLLHGETGAGKTSVLDAISYALFNSVPGFRQKAGRLRCDQADPELPTSASLELTVAGRRVRVRRTMEWQRPKRRGTGTTRQPATALLEEWRDRRWACLSTRIDEVSHQLLDWIGMSAEQFFQVVLLPQGDFAAFLLAETKDREALLERLFGTQRFADVQRWLAGRQADCRVQVELYEATMRSYLNRLCQELALPVGDEPSLADADEVWRGAQVTATQRAAAAAEAAMQEAADALVVARLAADGCAQRRRLQERLFDIDGEERALAAAAPDIANGVRELATARRAAVVVPLLAGLTHARHEQDAAAGEVAERLRSLTPVLAELAEAKDADPGDQAALTRLERSLREQCGRLADLAGSQTERDDHAEVARVTAAWVSEQSLLIAEATARRAALPAMIATAAEQETLAVAAGAGLPGLAATVDAAESALAAGRVAASIQIQLPALTAAAQSAVDRHQACTRLVLELREQRLAGMAAELAGRLTPDEPCPVCGSDVHPAPAAAGAAVITEADERGAAGLQEQAAQARSAAELARATGEAELAAALAGSGARPVAQLRRRLVAATAALAAAEDLAAGGDGHSAEVAQRRTELEQLGTLLADAEAETATQREREAAARAAVARIDDRLEAARGEDASVECRLTRLTLAADRVAGLLSALRTDQGARRAFRRAEAAASAEAGQAGFPDLATAAAAVRNPAEMLAWEGAAESFARREAALQQARLEPGLDDPAVRALAGQPPLDLSPSLAALAGAETDQTRCVSAAIALRRRATEVARLAGRLAEAEQAAVPVREEHAEVRALADLVAGQGQNTRSMTLRAYVLASRLAEVAQSASLRLRQMSGGRYTFQHTDLADSRRVRAGLGLVVIDDYSGLARSTRTLSGGETFLASLALALGLADVVTAEAGGVQLDTLFIDEGFGSLDADTLDQVMSTLDELRAGGRVVGVVSHVEEMRARIPSRLHVHKRRDGSVLEQISA